MRSTPTPSGSPEPAIWLCDGCDSGGLEESRDAALDAIQMHLWHSEHCGDGRRGEVRSAASTPVPRT